jgi:hypothetical protein
MLATAQTPLNQPPAYERATYRASKFGLSIEATIELASASDRGVMPWPDDFEGEGVLPRDGRWMSLVLDRSGLGRSSRTRLLLDADDGRAIQRSRLELGSSDKVTRYGTTGILVVRRRPEPGESGRPAPTWPDVSTRFEPFPRDAQIAHGVSDPSALFYVLAAGALRRPGDSWTIPVFASDAMANVEMRAKGWEQIEVDHVDGSERAPRTVRALHVAVATTSNNRRVDDEVNVLGISGDFEVWLDPERRVPVLIRGRAPLVGQVDIRLRQVE